MKYLYSYQSITRFAKPVIWHTYLLRIDPQENSCQRLVQQSVFLEPGGREGTGTDGLGNKIRYGTVMEPHTGFAYVSSGIVELADEYCIPDEGSVAPYKAATTLTQMSEDMQKWLSRVKQKGSVLEQALTLSHRLYRRMKYVPLSTQNATSAAQAFGQKKGVCQDYAHILLALCRARGLTARYVCGLIEGEGSTHAWVEVYGEDRCWRGVDPTHDTLITTGYIKLAHGRDVNDCPVNRGLYRGYTQEENQVRVIVTEL